MEESASAVVDLQAPQSTVPKSKKKSKNKKNTGRIEGSTETATATLTAGASSKKSPRRAKSETASEVVSTNGICEKFNQELHISEKLEVDAHQVNGIFVDIAPDGNTHVSLNGHHIPTADDKVNGDCVVSTKSKNINSEHNPGAKNQIHIHCHTSARSNANTGSSIGELLVVQSGPELLGDVEKLENGFSLDEEDKDMERSCVRIKVVEAAGNRKSKIVATAAEQQQQPSEGATETEAAVNAAAAAAVDATVDAAVAVAAAAASAPTDLPTAKPSATTIATVDSTTTLTESNSSLDLSEVLIEYKEYESELQMHDIMHLIQAELSEPYSIYTYRYFIYNWPKLCFLAAHGKEYVGAIVCKLDMHMNVKRGYIAMLAVRKEYRKLKIGTTLVQKAIEAMLADNADEVVLETEMRNLPALRLYENLGFVRDKRLFRYYLNGVDALRLKLWFR